MSLLHDWREEIDLSPYKKEIESLSQKREKQKYGYKTSRQWSSQPTNLTGLKGEFAFSLCTGLPVDKQLKRGGDSGVDFIYEGISYDVKSTTYDGANPMLLEMRDKKLVAHVYVLVRIYGWRAKIIGWVSRRQMRHARVKDLGYGMRLCFSEREMEEIDQDTIPPYVPSVSTNQVIAEKRSEKQLSNTGVILKLPKEIDGSLGQPHFA